MLKLKEKLKKARRESRFAYLISTVAVLYFLMTCIKGLYLWTAGSNFHIVQNIHFDMNWIIAKTYVFPIDALWRKIPSMPLEERSVFGFYKVLIPPAVVLLTCSLFIRDHHILKAKYQDVKAEIEKEIALRDMRKDAGIETIPESATVDIIINSATNSDPLWHDTWWGRITIGVAIVLIVTAFGIK